MAVDVVEVVLPGGLVVVGASVVVAAVLTVDGGAVVVVVATVVVGAAVVAGGRVVDVVVDVGGLVGRIWAPAPGPAAAVPRAMATARSAPQRKEGDGIGGGPESSVALMEPPDDPREEEAQGEDEETAARPWGPGSPAPGTPVMAFDVGGPEEKVSNGSVATQLYESARFPDPAVSPQDAIRRAKEEAGQSGSGPEQGTLRILGVPAPPEIAGPVLAGLAVVLAVVGWRWRRRRRSR